MCLPNHWEVISISKPRFDWWSQVIWSVRNYPNRKKEYEQLHSQSVTAGGGGAMGSEGVNRRTENIALRQLPPAKQNEYDAVTKALEITKMKPDGDKRIDLIRRMYWEGKKLRVTDVIMHVGIAEATGWRWHSEFIELVGVLIGYEYKNHKR